MHTTYTKLSAKEREAAPRFYYKRTQKVTCLQRIKDILRKLVAFFFGQIGICALVAGYMVMGAFLFENLEAESQMEHAVNFTYLFPGFIRMVIFCCCLIFRILVAHFNLNIGNGKDAPYKFYRRRLGNNLPIQHIE